MSPDIDGERVLRPLHNTTKGHFALLVVFGLAALWLLVAWVYQLRGGMMTVTNLGDWGTAGGVPWGLYIGAFVWWIGIAHGGIAISAAVTVFKIERFRPIARIAEVLTVFALGMAAANIVFSLGRPDRIFNTIVQWPLTVYHSPLAWDIAVITLYLVLSLTYITLSLRDEIYALRPRLPWWLGPIYSVILLGYRPAESEKVEQITWWLAVAILALVPLLSGGVVPWLFGLIAAQPGWFGAAAGPSMLVESLTSAMAFVIIVVAAFRYAYGWEDMIEEAILVDLSKVLALLVLATIWFVIHDVLTGLYLAPAHIDVITETMLTLPFFWLAIGGLLVSFTYLAATVLRPDWFSIPVLVVVSGVVAISILNKKVMFIVEGLMHPSVPPLTNLYPAGEYFPNWVEWSLVLGSIVLVGLGFVIVSKIIPMIELEDAGELVDEPRSSRTDGDSSPDVAADGGVLSGGKLNGSAADTERQPVNSAISDPVDTTGRGVAESDTVGLDSDSATTEEDR
ncbi:NrfD/PsrC family molybdoenzyme membrane anchor subunit [Halovivax gelatinilyticus]|uniref:NrfD/PsrC family molybdoenzyme membrane anchor subunit n=1 Tax=Halovivax gelatinilyticus TaxID=2961597 RepID=UPI0020CA831E|nr:NrfD/PsrC family molybdoenzyme membrane anchor subunit [Halovivax gelatinilyticus]